MLEKWEWEWEEFEEDDLRTKSKKKLIKDCEMVIKSSNNENEIKHYERLLHLILTDSDQGARLIDNVIKYKLY